MEDTLASLSGLKNRGSLKYLFYELRKTAKKTAKKI